MTYPYVDFIHRNIGCNPTGNNLIPVLFRYNIFIQKENKNPAHYR